MAGIDFTPSVAGIACAAASVVGGAPLFSMGLRAWRRRRAVASLREAPIAELPTGYVQISGRVGLESPLITPLSGKACAGFRLEAHGADIPVARSIEELRDFRLVAGGVSAHVPGQGEWDLPITAERVLAPDEPVTERLQHLLEQMPEACWIRESGRRVRLVERALLAGTLCQAIGHAVRGKRSIERGRVAMAHGAERLLRTGTDDLAIQAATSGPALATAVATHANAGAVSAEPAGAMVSSSREAAPAYETAIFLGAHDAADLLRVSVHAPTPGALRSPAHQLAGLAVGPLLALGGLIYLAIAADHWRATGGF